MLGAPYKNQVRATGLVFANYHTAYDIGRWPNAMVTYPEVGLREMACDKYLSWHAWPLAADFTLEKNF